MSGEALTGRPEARQRLTGADNRNVPEKSGLVLSRGLNKVDQSDELEVNEFVTSYGPFGEQSVRTETRGYPFQAPKRPATPETAKAANSAPVPAAPTPIETPPPVEVRKPERGVENPFTPVANKPSPTTEKSHVGSNRQKSSATAGYKTARPPVKAPPSKPTLPPKTARKQQQAGTENRLAPSTPPKPLDALPQEGSTIEIWGKSRRTMEEAAGAIRETRKWSDQKFAQEARNFYYKQFREAYQAEADKSATLANSVMMAEMSPLIFAYGLMVSGWAAAEIFSFLEEIGMGVNAAVRMLFQTGSLTDAATIASRYPALVTAGVVGTEIAVGDTGVSSPSTGTMTQMESRAAGASKGAINRTTKTTVDELFGREGDQAVGALVRRNASRAESAVAREIVELQTSLSGSKFFQYRGRYFSVPKGMTIADLPTVDNLGDEMQLAVQRIANRFNANLLTAAQKRSLRNAAPSARGGLMVAYKGSWVHAEMENQFWDIAWFRRGIDAKGQNLSYEVLTWTEHGVDIHLGRKGGMDDTIWRGIYYYEGSSGMGKYLKQLGL